MDHLDVSGIPAAQRSALFQHAGIAVEVSSEGIRPVGAPAVDRSEFEGIETAGIAPGVYTVPSPDDLIAALEQRIASNEKAKAISRDSFDKMSAADRMSFVKNGGQVFNPEDKRQ